MNSIKINGIKIYAPITRKELIDFAFEKKRLLIAINAEKILNATDDSRVTASRNIGYPDGIGAIMALNNFGFKNVKKVPGCELWLDIISAHSQTKSFYLVGGKDDVIERTIKQLRRDFPEINIVNYRNGYFNCIAERNELIQDIVEKKPDVVFVAMGSPAQELLMEDMSSVHEAVYQGLGGSFDVYTNKVKRAPVWWVENGLEWLYRLLKEPSRLKRQIHLVRFFIMIKFNAFK